MFFYFCIQKISTARREIWQRCRCQKFFCLHSHDRSCACGKDKNTWLLYYFECGCQMVCVFVPKNLTQRFFSVIIRMSIDFFIWNCWLWFVSISAPKIAPDLVIPRSILYCIIRGQAKVLCQGSCVDCNMVLWVHTMWSILMGLSMLLTVMMMSYDMLGLVVGMEGQT